MKKPVIKIILIISTFIIISISALFSFYSWTLREYSQSNWDCL